MVHLNAGMVLLAEDDDGVRVMLRAALEREGYTVLEAEDGDQAVTIAEAHAGHIALLVTDVMMPKLKGLDVASALAPENPSMKVLYMSGADDSIIVESLAASGQAGQILMRKPFTGSELVSRVRELLCA